MYHYFGEITAAYINNRQVSVKFQKRWDFIKKDVYGLSYILSPKNVAAGNFFTDKGEVMGSIRRFVSHRNDGEAQAAQEQMVQYVHEVLNYSASKKEMTDNMTASQYWDIFGKSEFPLLYKYAKMINAMTCTSAASERAWSIFGFVHTPLRNRLANDKVNKVVFLYMNSGFMDSKDKTDYIIGSVNQSISGRIRRLIEFNKENLKYYPM